VFEGDHLESGQGIGRLLKPTIGRTKRSEDWIDPPSGAGFVKGALEEIGRVQKMIMMDAGSIGDAGAANAVGAFFVN
jgi:hypothetical protein